MVAKHGEKGPVDLLRHRIAGVRSMQQCGIM